MSRSFRRLAVASLVLLGAMLGLVRIKDEVPTMPSPPPILPQTNGLAEHSSQPIGRPLDVVFLHHSIGEHWLSDPPGAGASQPHENGGGLRRALSNQGYRVHDASYGSKLGEQTDLFDWLPKFGGHRALSTSRCAET